MIRGAALALPLTTLTRDLAARSVAVIEQWPRPPYVEDGDRLLAKADCIFGPERVL